MGLLRFTRVLVLTTVAALGYVHMQMTIVRLGYRGRERERRLTELRDGNGALTYRILRLKSARHLGDRLLTADSGFRFSDGRDVIYLVAAPEGRTGEARTRRGTSGRAPWSRVFSLRAEAEADQ